MQSKSFIGYSSITEQTYPPHDIYKVVSEDGNDEFYIEVAAAGFEREELSASKEGQILTISGKKAEETSGPQIVMKHKGIARRKFELRFQLSDTVKVSQVDFINGILKVSMINVIPEELKPKHFTIN